MTTLPEASYSDLYVVNKLLQQLPDNSTLHLANSQSVYLSQLFSIPNTVYRFCNRGTNGIEGSISTAVGYASASDRLTLLLTGDLSFFYDMNGLWNRQLSSNLRILLNNNGGGVQHAARSQSIQHFYLDTLQSLTTPALKDGLNNWGLLILLHTMQKSWKSKSNCC